MVDKEARIKSLELIDLFFRYIIIPIGIKYPCKQVASRKTEKSVQDKMYM